jgi:diaminopimelate decarboxylase
VVPVLILYQLANWHAPLPLALQQAISYFPALGKAPLTSAPRLAAGIGQINAESAAEVAQISAVAAAMGVAAPVALRVNVDVDAGTHAKISTGQRDTKFGISTDQREAATLYAELAADPHIKPMGLAVHIGSQICDLAPFERAYSALLDVANGLRAGGLEVPCLDLGGGVGVDYQQAGDTDFSAYGSARHAAVQDRRLPPWV